MPPVSWVESDVLRNIGYLLLGSLMLLAFRQERRWGRGIDGAWPPFWIHTGVFVLALGLARALQAGDLLSALGRSAANEGGWYDSRRPLQAAVVATVGLVWVVTVGIALWRTPERRRRYLSVGLLVVTLAAFAAIRVVSLHQIDTVLYGTTVGGVRIATVIEIGLVVLTAAATARRVSDVGWRRISERPLPGDRASGRGTTRSSPPVRRGG